MLTSPSPRKSFLISFVKLPDCGLGVNFDTGNAATFAADPLALLESVDQPGCQRARIG